MIPRHTTRLFLCGASLLFWELVLIRWLGSCVRIVGYYTNFVLIAAFFGLGVGALLARFRFRLEALVLPAIAATVLMGSLLGRFSDLNPHDASEYFWGGGPLGVDGLGTAAGAPALPFWAVLAIVYCATTVVYVAFGQWVGNLFKGLAPVRAYTVEIGGSIAGIALFGAMSFMQFQPAVWMAVGSVMVLITLGGAARASAVAAACAVPMVAIVWMTNGDLTWSPYYKIKCVPIRSVVDPATRTPHQFPEEVGYALTVNNDYHQMMLDLGTGPVGEHKFISDWRTLYEAPYDAGAALPPGPILVVGAGTGNDVMAALRRTDREIVAVDIDPAIVSLGRRLHPEKPYDDPRVTVVIDDARSYFQKTDRKFAMVVFGYLDSHTLLSSFSSLRLDNFVYTIEAIRQVKRILVPGGQVSLTFCTNTPWLHGRFIDMLGAVFRGKTDVRVLGEGSYAYGTVYRNMKRGDDQSEELALDPSGRNLPTDNWPFLYLEKPRIPGHYRGFLAIILAMGFLPFLILPRGERSIRLPYFFMGAAFFLLETSNVVSLSLLFGSTWMVNAFVFAGILLLVLLGNLTAMRLDRRRLPVVFAGIVVTLAIARFTPVSALLAVDPRALQSVLAVPAFLGPVYFAAVAFALLIRDETRFYQAYGSNILGAVLGGALEYLSLVLGFKFLLLLTAGFYLMAWLALRAPAARAGCPVPAAGDD
jgi:SAM-dependent methyltransferase